MSHFERQIERNAIEAYVVYGVRPVTLPLSARARRELGRIRRSVAGLQEMQAVATMVRNPFESNVAFGERQLVTATAVRAATVALEG